MNALEEFSGRIASVPRAPEPGPTKEPPMRRSLRLAMLVLMLPLLACTKGEECDTCTKDDDCKGGFVCSNFSDGSRRCGTGNPESPTKCRVP
jgi:hypothetical protein